MKSRVALNKHWQDEKLKWQISMAERLNGIDAAIILGGLVVVAVAGSLFAAFPLYQLLDSSSVRRPVWNPPSVVIREPGAGLTPADIARLEQDPRQKELLQGLKNGITYQPSPSWLGYRKVDLNKPVRGRRWPTNGLLYVWVLSVGGYVYALRHRGII